MSEERNSSAEPVEEYGITETDIERITEYVKKPRHARTAGELESSTDE